jgi:predicted nucleic acid-binding protein
MKRVLIDSNIILDVALRRKPFIKISSRIFDKIGERKIKGFVTASSITDIYYLMKKVSGREKTLAFIRELTGVIEVLNVTKRNIIDALNTNFKDFEDAVQYCVAEMNRIDIIVTRDKSDFNLSSIEVCTPDELIKKLSNF